MRYAATADGLVRARDGVVELLDLPFTDLGAALAAGLERAELDAAPARRTVDEGALVLAAPVARPGDIWAAGASYRDHVAETSDDLPEMSEELAPLFLKASSSVTGPDTEIVLPPLAPDRVDWEGEVALIVGRAGTRIDPADGWDHIFGVTAANDVSARDVQGGTYMGGMMDMKAKSFDTFTPLGPWVVTPDEYEDRDDIGLRLLVNGHERQSDRTSGLLYPVGAMVAAVTQFGTISPGDVILTGTPGGVGYASGTFLAAGDEVVVEVERAGRLVNRVVAA